MIGINPYRIGMSEAGKRIHDAGLRYSASHPEPIAPLSPPPPPEPSPSPSKEDLIALEAASIPAGRCHQILSEVAAKHGLTAKQLRSDSRKRSIIMARFEAAYRCAAETDASIAMIGRAFNRDHTSIGSAIMRYSFINRLTPPRGMVWRRKEDQRRERERRKKEQAKAIQYARDAA